MVFQSKWTNFTQRKKDNGCWFFPPSPKKCAQQGIIQPIILLRIWVTHGVSPWKKYVVAVFVKKKWFNKASNYSGEPCIFKALTWIWFSKVNGPALPKERCIKVDKVPPENLDLRKKSHNRGQPHHLQDALYFLKKSHNRVPWH